MAACWRLENFLMLDLLLAAAGIKKGHPLPADVQKILDEQADILADKIAHRVAAVLAASFTPTKAD